MQLLKSVNWKDIPNLPRFLIVWVTSLIEFLTDHMHGSLGHIMIKASPLMAPAPSAIAIYGALHDRFGTGNALSMVFVFEALGFAAVYIKTRLEQHNRSQPANMQPLDKANIAVSAYFLVTEVSIILFEVVPSWARWYVDGDLVTALTHTAPIIFPVFSYIGANIYSMMDSLTEIEERAAAELAEKKENVDAKMAALVAERDRLLIAVDAGKVELAAREQDLREVAQMHDLSVQSGRQERAELEKQLAVLDTEKRMLEIQLSSVRKDVELFRDHSLHVQPTIDTRPSAVQVPSKLTKREGQLRLVQIVQGNGNVSLADIGKEIGVSKSTVGNYVTELCSIGVLDKLPGGGLRVNGNHEAFLSGKL